MGEGDAVVDDPDDHGLCSWPTSFPPLWRRRPAAAIRLVERQSGRHACDESRSRPLRFMNSKKPWLTIAVQNVLATSLRLGLV